MRVIPLLLMTGLLVAPSHSALADEAAPAVPAAPIVHWAQIDNQIINPVTSDYLTAAIDRAEAAGAQCLVIELDTPGGLLESTRTIVKRMMSANVPLVVYVAPSGARAGSAGVFITLASHVAAMAPTTNIGAAHPVTADGGGPVKKLIRRFQDDTRRELDPTSAKKSLAKRRPTETEEITESDPMSEKILHDTVAWITGIATARGRSVEWAKRSVEDSASVTAPEALSLGAVDLIADSSDDLLAQLDGRTIVLPRGPVVLHTREARRETIPLSRRQRVLLTLTNPTVAYLLMMLGFWGLVTEITHPGLAFPGIAGAVCLVLALFALQTLPVNYAGVALIVIGLALLIAEIKVISYGLLAVGGLVCLTLGSLLLIDSPYAFLRVSLQVILPMVLSIGAFVVLLLGAVVRTHRRPVTTGVEGMVGETGVASTELRPAGQVFVHGETWNATATRPVAQGAAVRVVRVDRLMLTVEPL